MKFNSLKAGALLVGLFLSTNLLATGPRNFVTKNYTPYQSNAIVKNIKSPYPTPAGTATSPAIRAVPWIQLRMICGVVATECTAKILMKTDTANPIEVGEGTLRISDGDITPKEMVKNGFRLTSPEAGVIEIREVDPTVPK